MPSGARTRVLAATAAAVAVALAPIVAGAEPGTGPFTALPRVLSSGPTGYSTYDAVSCGAPSSCVAVGPGASPVTTVAGSLHGFATAVTETSGVWGAATRLPLPAGALGTANAAEVEAISCPSATSCTAVGAYKTGAQTLPLVDTDAAGAWTASSLTPPVGAAGSSAIDAVWCASAGSCETVGFYQQAGSSIDGLDATETGGTWAQSATLPAPVDAFATVPLTLSCAAIGTCAAAGIVLTHTGAPVPYVWTESAGTWAAPTRLAALGSLTFVPSSIACATSTTCIVVGTATGSKGTLVPAVATERTGTWSVARLALPRLWPEPTGGELQSVSCDPAVCVAVGFFASPHQKAAVAGAVTWSSGSWSSVDLVHGVRVGAAPATGSLFSGVACTSVTSCTAVGDAITAGATNNPLAATVEPVRAVTPPGPPVGVEAAPTPTGARVAWEPPVDDGGGPVLSFTASVAGGGTCHTTGLACAIGGLRVGHAYAVTVTATNSVGISGPSAPAVVVAGPIPSSPAHLEVAVGGSVATLTWHASRARGEHVLRYVVTVTARGKGRVVFTTTPRCRVGGIVAHRVYDVTVVAQDASGASAPAHTHFHAP